MRGSGGAAGALTGEAAEAAEERWRGRRLRSLWAGKSERRQPRGQRLTASLAPHRIAHIVSHQNKVKQSEDVLVC